jgi:hypothetical protein
MPDDDDRRTRVRRALERSAELRQHTADLAGAIAETEQQVAATRRKLAQANPSRSDEHLAAAAEADSVATHERAERRRLSKPAEPNPAEPDPAEPDPAEPDPAE